MDYASLLATAYLFLGVLTALLGLVLFRENPGVRLNRVTALMLVFAGVGAVLGAGSLMVQRTGGDSSILRSSLVANFAYLWEFFFPLLLLFAATFPRERTWLRSGWGEALIFLPHTIHFLLMFIVTMLGPNLGLEGIAGGVPAFGAFLDLLRILLERLTAWHRQLFSLVNLVYVLLSVFLIAQNLSAERNASVRSQLRTILAGIGVAFTLYLVAIPINLLFDLELAPHTSSTFLVLALAACSGTIAYAIVRHRFLDARWIVRRTILYALASALLVAFYIQIVREVGRNLEDVFHLPEGVLDWVALVVPLVLFQPVMARFEELFEGFMLRGGRELRSTFGHLSDDISRSLDFDAIAANLVRELPEVLTIRGAAVLLARPAGAAGAYRIVAAQGFSQAELAPLARAAEWLPEANPPGNPHAPGDWTEALGKEAASSESEDAPGPRRAPSLSLELRHRGERLGLLLLGPKISGTRTSREEITLLTALANQAAIALRNSFLYKENLEKVVLEEELALARRIQQAFIPSRFPTDLPVEVHGVNLPSKQVGGDYFDFFRIESGGYAIAIADVSGKGVGAALLASMLQASLRTLMRDGTSPGRVVERVNGLLCESTTPEQFVTLFLGRLDLARMELTYVNAGHNYPIVARDGASRMLLPSELVLGVDEQASYPERTVTLGRGDSLLLYTDGVTEARRADGEEFGEDRLAEMLIAGRSDGAAEVVCGIRDSVLRFTGTGEVQDDMTLLLVRVTPQRSAGPIEAREATRLPTATPA